MKGYRTTIEKKQLSDDLVHKIQLTTDEETLFLMVVYKDGRFIIERNFKNNYIGIEQMSRICEKFNTDEKVIKHLGLGEKNEQS